MTLSAIMTWDPEAAIEAVAVEDANGGVWWPNDDAQAEIQAAGDPLAAAVKMCDESPMRGNWVS